MTSDLEHRDRDIRCPNCQGLDIIIIEMVLIGSCRCNDCGSEFYIKDVVVEMLKERGTA